jgi:hypothetical protein
MTPVPPEDSDITEEEMMAKLLEIDPMVDRLCAISQDAPLPSVSTAWIHKFVGDKQIYLTPSGEKECYALNIFKSLRWPGAITVQQADKWVSVYFGYGVKGGTESYFPVNPPVVNEDPADCQEQSEPNSPPHVEEENLEEDD